MAAAYIADVVIALAVTASNPHPDLIHSVLGRNLTRAACDQAIAAEVKRERVLVANGQGTLTASCVINPNPPSGAPLAKVRASQLEVFTTHPQAVSK